MVKVLLEIIGMSYSHSQSGAYALILGESQGKRRLPIIIGGFEAQAIALGLEKLQPARPMTHDLMHNMLLHYDVKLTEVLIYKFREGVFHALLICEKDGVVSQLDARTSDAVALSIRFQCPVYTYETILEEAGILMENEDEETSEPTDIPASSENEFSDYLSSELEEMLEKAIENEDYEQAGRLRDELNQRKSKL